MRRTARTSHRPRRRHWLRMLAWLLVLGLLAGLAAGWLAYRQLDRTPSELLRYAERRLYGHTRLEAVALPVVHHLRARVERQVPPDLPGLGKGVQARPLSPVRYEASRPVGQESGGLQLPPNRSVASLEELQRAMQAARPGEIIELLPGRYMMRTNMLTPVAGNAAAPITVRAALPGSVEIHSSALEGFVVTQPYWTFENLTMRGVCAHDGDCEHAFHVVGAARGTVIRNNRLVDFNAQLKINGDAGQYPDDGLAQFNTLENSRPRRTHLPVTPIDLVGASRWTVADNLITNFHKADGNAVSYGVFMKGGGSHGRIERNLVVCSRTDISAAGSRPGTGARIGISLGGGGTGTGFCRDSRCDAEHMHGLVANNIVAHCNDAGIDVNASAQSIVAHNTLINTGWIDLRNAPASADVMNNWFEGRVRTRDGGWVHTQGNETGALARYVDAPDALQLAWREQPPMAPPLPATLTDFCERPRSELAPPGAIGQTGLPCTRATHR